MALSTITLKNLRRKVAAALGGFDWGYIASATTDTLVALEGRLAGKTPQTYVGWYLFRPDTTSALDRVKVVTQFTPSSRTFTHSHGNSDYIDTAVAGTVQNIDLVVNMAPIRIQLNSHGYSEGDIIVIASVGGCTAANGTWSIVSVSTDSFYLAGSVGNAEYTSGGTASKLAETWEVHRYLDPDDANGGWFKAINNGLSRIYRKTVLPLTLIPDGDMQASGVTTHWGGTLTLAKSATAAYWGTQGLSLTWTATGQKGYSSNVAVTQGDGYSWGALVKGAGTHTNPRVTFYDVTNSATIRALDVSDMGLPADKVGDWVFINGADIIPSGCLSARIEIDDTTDAAGTMYVGAVWLQRQAATRWVLPSTITERGQIIRFLQVTNVSPRPDEWVLAEVHPVRLDFDPNSANNAVAWFSGPATRFLLLEAWQPISAFAFSYGTSTSLVTHESSSVSVDEGLAVAAIKAEALHLIEQHGIQWRGDDSLEEAIAKAEIEYQSLAHLSQRPELRTAETLWVQQG